MYADTPRNPVAQVNREIPKEVLFRLSSDASNMARQDPIKKNRYWFKVPEEWSNRNYKDKVLGIRRMYLLEHYFDIRFDLIITVEDPPPELTKPAPRAFTFYILNCLRLFRRTHQKIHGSFRNCTRIEHSRNRCRHTNKLL
jgi:hypothetical protein